MKQAAVKFDHLRFSEFENQWIEIFRAGDYGKKGKWTPEDLDQVVSNFSSGVWTPPAVFGHPKEDSPAHGWVAALKREGDSLFARFNQVSEQLDSAVKNGRFPNRSAAFYVNPKGSGPVLRHVGFLGGTPPEIKDLRPIAFLGGGFSSIDFVDEPHSELHGDNSSDRRTTKMKIGDVLVFAAEHNGGLLFGEGARIAVKSPNFSGRVPVSASSITMSERASEIARERGCDFGTALKAARREMEFGE